jgi:hypothetical protein
MSRRLIILLPAAALVVLGGLQISSVDADGGKGRPPPSTSTIVDGDADAETGSITAVAGAGFVGGRVGVGQPAPRPRCTYEVVLSLPTFEGPGPPGPFHRDEGRGPETLYWQSCDGGVPVAAWLLDTVNVDDVINSAVSRVSALLPKPVIDISPAAEVGGTVNVGMWLAVDDPGRYAVTANQGSVTATVAACTITRSGTSAMVTLSVVRGWARRLLTPTRGMRGRVGTRTGIRRSTS